MVAYFWNLPIVVITAVVVVVIEVAVIAIGAHGI